MENRGFNHDDGIFYTAHQGGINYDEMLGNMQAIGSLVRYTKNLKILEDGRGSAPVFTPEELKKLIAQIELHTDIFESVKHAVVHSDPTATAYAHMVGHMNSCRKYSIRVFSTVEAAKFWLKG